MYWVETNQRIGHFASEDDTGQKLSNVLDRKNPTYQIETIKYAGYKLSGILGSNCKMFKFYFSLNM